MNPKSGTSVKLILAEESLGLADHTTVTLQVTGAKPLRVEPPTQWLDDDSKQLWKATPLAEAQTTELADGHERWQLSLRLEPYVSGPEVPLGLSSVKVTAGANEPQELTFPLSAVKVTTSIQEPSGDLARPIVGYDRLPEPPNGSSTAWQSTAGVALLCVILGLSGVWLYWRFRTVRRKPIDPLIICRNELLDLKSDINDDVRPVAARIMAIVRAHFSAKFDLPDQGLTDQEWLRVYRQTQTDMPLTTLEDLIKLCNESKYAIQAKMNPKGLIDMAIGFIEEVISLDRDK